MSNKLNGASETIVAKKSLTENCKQISPISNTQLSSKETPKGILVYDNCSTLIEVTVKAKGRKRTSTMVSNGSSGHKAIEDKKRPGGSGDSCHSWSRILREQNRPIMKQSIQQCISRNQSTKSTKQTVESKEVRKSMDAQKTQKFEFTNHATKRLNEMVMKSNKSHRITDDRLKTPQNSTIPSATSLASSVDSILVTDKSVQCGGLFDSEDPKFDAFNPVRTLAFLMKELEDVVKDERSNKILNHMEQVLFKIPTYSVKKPTVDLEAITLRNKLEASTVQLEEMSKKMNTMCESLRDEKNSLQKQVHKQAILLEEAGQKRGELEMLINKLRIQIEEMSKSIEINKRTVSELNEENKRLKAELREQEEVARQRNLELQYLKLEKEKILVLSGYKESQLNDLRSAVKELPNYISEQLLNLKDSYKYDDNVESSVIQGGLACSSPSSSMSERSIVPISWRDHANISLSTVEYNPSRTLIGTQVKSKKKSKTTTSAEKLIESIERNKRSNFQEPDINDTEHLEFVSLAAGESTHAFLRRTDQTHKDNSLLDEIELDRVPSNNKKNVNSHEYTKEAESSDNLSSMNERTNRNVRNKRSPPKPKRSFRCERKQSLEKTVLDDTPNLFKQGSSGDAIVATIKEQFKNMFEDMRLQSRMPVNVPSPPRNFPHPEWSDSSLPSISGTSELIIAERNKS